MSKLKLELVLCGCIAYPKGGSVFGKGFSVTIFKCKVVIKMSF